MGGAQDAVLEVMAPYENYIIAAYYSGTVSTVTCVSLTYALCQR